MTQRALVISKDLVNELKRLATLASKDDEAMEEARKRYVRAGEAVVSSSSTFAIALYDFALRYADQVELVEAKLNELDIQFKRTSSVYVKLARLAFDDVRDEKGEVSRARVSRYASIIEAAHAAELTADQFEKSVERGITQALRKLRNFGQAPESNAVEIGREIVSDLVGRRTFAIEQFPLPENATEGDDVELLARVEGGKLVVYGVLPPSVSNLRSMLSKLGTQVATDAVQVGHIIPDLLRSIKLVTGSKDTDSLARYEIQGGRVHFVVFGVTASAAFTAPVDCSCFGSGCLTLKVSEWRRILETLTPLRKQISSIAVDSSQITVEFDESTVPDVDIWFEQNGKAKKIGVSDGATLSVALTIEKIEHDCLAGLKWLDAVTVTQDELAQLLSFQPSKKLVSIPLVAGVLQPTAGDKALKNHVNIRRKSFSSLRAATKKLLRLSPKLDIERADDYMRVTSKYGDGFELSFTVPAV